MQLPLPTTEAVVKAVLSLGSAKWLWDVARYLWKRFYASRVTVDLFIAYENVRTPNKPLQKSTFLVVHNQTDLPVNVTSLVFENSFWKRLFSRKATPRTVGSSIDWRVPAKGSSQVKFGYAVGNLLEPRLAYFGVQIDNDKTIWLKTSKWLKAIDEYKKDFPFWSGAQPRFVPVEFRQYGE